jgi:hypothetical protein
MYSWRAPRPALTMICAVLLAWGASAPVGAQAEQGSYIELDPALIAGDQELPRVLYILPWRQPDSAPLAAPALPDAIDGLLRPLYPPAHRRELDYYRQIEAMATEE